MVRLGDEDSLDGLGGGGGWDGGAGSESELDGGDNGPAEVGGLTEITSVTLKALLCRSKWRRIVEEVERLKWKCYSKISI